VVGWSPNPERPSHRVAAFLHARGYEVFAVNPGQAGRQLFGREIFASLADLARARGPLDMVDVFRRSEQAGEVVDQAIALGAKGVWLQLGVVDGPALARARAAGLWAVMNRCPAIELA